MSTFDIVPATFLKWSLLHIALGWLTYRFYQVLSKPLEELANQLGFEIPSTPQIALAGLRCNGAIIHFSLPEKQKPKSSQKFEIYLNGANVATIPAFESAVTVTGLQPATHYIARVGVVNSAEFASRSTPIHFRTKLASTNDFYTIEGLEDVVDSASQPLVRVTPYRGLKDVAPASPDVTPMIREGSAGLGARRSTVGLRRPSPSIHSSDKQSGTRQGNQSEETEVTVQQLTEKLDAIRREAEEVERLAKEDEEEDMRIKEALIEERDRLKAEAMEATKASKILKNEVQTLERQNTAAQNERTKWHRALEQKKQERQKFRDDVARWEKETTEAKLGIKRLEDEKEEHSVRFEEQKEALAAKLVAENTLIKNLEDELKAKTLQIKQLENEIKNISPDVAEAEPSLVQQMQHDVEEQRLWDLRYTRLQQDYARVFQREQAAKQYHDNQVKLLQDVRARRRAEDVTQYSSPQSAQERNSRTQRAPSGHSSNNSPSMSTFKPLNSSPFGPSLAGTSSIFAPPPASFSNSAPMNGIAFSDADRDRLTGGALMSPGAGEHMIPKDLFTENEAREQWEREQQARMQTAAHIIAPLPGLGALPNMTIPGLGPASVQAANEQWLSDLNGAGATSPASETSRSHSVFASPHASQPNLQLGSPDHVMDADRQSVRSVRSNRAPSGGNAGSRFSGMFGIKSRSKAPRTEEGLPLGKIQSHSMPRYDDGIPGIDSSTRKRNSSISGSVFDGPFATESPYGLPPEPGARRRAFNLFQKDTKVWPTTFGPPRPASPRPASTHSNELPRPSTESSRWIKDLWTSDDAASGNRSSPLSFGSAWNPPASQASRLFPSRHPSRRTSLQYSSLGPHEDIPEDDNDADVLDPDQESQLAPIGTKPTSRKAEKQAAVDATKLNPAAKDFRSLFAGMKSRDKTKHGSTSSATGTPTVDGAEFGESPPASRKSKDNRDTLSLTTTESSFTESGHESPSLARTPSYGNSETAPSPFLGGSSAQSKESFMAKLTRKSSSGKFALPTFKRDKPRVDANAGATSVPPTPVSAQSVAEDEEDAMSASVGSFRERDARESKDAARLGGRGWSNVLKLGRKKGNESPSLSGMSLASGGTAEEDDEDDGEDEPVSAT